MVTIDDITKAVIILVRLGVVARVAFCMIKLIGADDEATKYKTRARNAVIFYIIAECCWALRDLALYYYK